MRKSTMLGSRGLPANSAFTSCPRPPVCGGGLGWGLARPATHVLRFRNNGGLQNPDGAIEAVLRAIRSVTPTPARPHRVQTGDIVNRCSETWLTLLALGKALWSCAMPWSEVSVMS